MNACVTEVQLPWGVAYISNGCELKKLDASKQVYHYNIKFLLDSYLPQYENNKIIAQPSYNYSQVTEALKSVVQSPFINTNKVISVIQKLEEMEMMQTIKAKDKDVKPIEKELDNNELLLKELEDLQAERRSHTSEWLPSRRELQLGE